MNGALISFNGYTNFLDEPIEPFLDIQVCIFGAFSQTSAKYRNDMLPKFRKIIFRALQVLKSHLLKSELFWTSIR